MNTETNHDNEEELVGITLTSPSSPWVAFLLTISFFILLTVGTVAVYLARQRKRRTSVQTRTHVLPFTKNFYADDIDMQPGIAGGYCGRYKRSLLENLSTNRSHGKHSSSSDGSDKSAGSTQPGDHFRNGSKPVPLVIDFRKSLLRDLSYETRSETTASSGSEESFRDEDDQKGSGDDDDDDDDDRRHGPKNAILLAWMPSVVEFAKDSKGDQPRDEDSVSLDSVDII